VSDAETEPAFRRAEPRGRERHRREARGVKLAAASESNALQLVRLCHSLALITAPSLLTHGSESAQDR